LEAVFILLEFPSPSRRILIGSHSLPPLWFAVSVLHEVLAVEKAPPSFLDWSEDAITFSREDHLNRIPNSGQYPLVVDSVIGKSRFSKVLMDGDSSLKVLYVRTLRLIGIGLD
jgi:hypothetical protein